MKKLLLISILALPLLSMQKRTVTPREIGATYLSCYDSTKMNLSVTVTNNIANKVYAFTGSKTGATFSFTIVDHNSGSIVAGDSITVQSATYNICGNGYTLRTHAIPTVLISGSNVEVYYTDCILPLNGTVGSMYVKFTQ
jgi:hypothetical protein